DSITSNGGIDTIDGGAGDDTATIDRNSATADLTFDMTDVNATTTLVGDGTTVTGVENFTLTTGSGNDSITTGSGTDNIATGNGNDTINPGGSNGNNDSVNGGGGNDTLIADFSLSPTGVTSGALTGTLAAGYSGGFSDGVRTLSFSGVENFDVIGSESSDNIVTGGGHDTINPGQGSNDDTVDAGAGNDTLVADFSQSGASVTGGNLAGDVTNGYAGNFTDGARTLTFSGVENFKVTGGSGDDQITTGDGNDVLIGGAGTDTLHAGVGNDEFDVAAGDVNSGEIYDGGGGTDEIYVSGNVNFTGATLTSIEALGFGAPIASGATFTADQIGAGKLSDTLAVEGDAQGNLITVNVIAPGALDLSGWTFTDWSPIDPTLPDSVRVNGSSGDDTITGTKNAAGGDIVEGGLGNDRLVLDYSGIASGVSGGAAAPGGLDGSLGQFSTGGNVIGTFNNIDSFDITTGSGNDDITTGAGDDTIDGGAGADTMTGGAGSDTYYVDNAGDQVVEQAGDPGTDTVETAGGITYTLADNVENLRFNGGETLTGNAEDNLITAAATADPSKPVII
ncbi:MAG TPA: calcium-binding protein, partial [Thermomicrobiales bacterium]|nr:calcium-binding protein [Thermomicrobiales bacterium]